MTDEPSKPSKDALLGELESIKDLLDQHNLDEELDTSIPLLDDVVDDAQQQDSPDNKSRLLNLDSIFDDNGDAVLDQDNSDGHSDIDFDDLDDFDELDINIAIPDFTLSATVDENPQTNADNPVEHAVTTDQQSRAEAMTTSTDVCINLLIQEIVDEFIPSLEAQLRQRLSQYSPAVIKQLAQKHIKP